MGTLPAASDDDLTPEEDGFLYGLSVRITLLVADSHVCLETDRYDAFQLEQTHPVSYPATYGRNLVSFRPVTPEFKRPQCVQLASISTRVSLTTFARGRHC